MAIIVSRLMKDSDPEVADLVGEMDYSEKEEIKQMIVD